MQLSHLKSTPIFSKSLAPEQDSSFKLLFANSGETIMRQFIICGVILVLTFGMSGMTQAQWESSSGTFQTVNALATHNGTLYSSEGGQVYRTTDQGNSWTQFGTGLPFGTPGLVNAFASNGVDLFAGTLQRGVYQLMNDSVWVKNYTSGPPTSVFALVSKGNNLFAATNNGVVGIYRSTDNGFVWTPANTGLTSGFITELAVSGSNLFAGASDSGVFRSSDDGNSWTRTSNGLPPGENVWELGVQGTTLSAGVGLELYTSNDNGANWTPFSNGIDGFPVKAFATYGAYVFAGSGGFDGGVFSLEGGATTWTPINTGFPSAQPGVEALVADAPYLFAGINLGVWRRPLSQITSVEQTDDVGVPGQFSLGQNYPNPFNPVTHFEFRLPAGQAGIGEFGMVTLTIHDLLGREVATLVNEEMAVGSYKVTLNAAGLSSGVYLYRLTTENFTATRKLLLMK